MAFCDFLRDDEDKQKDPQRDRHPDDSFDVSAAFVPGSFLLTPYFERRLAKINAQALPALLERLRGRGPAPDTGADMETLILTHGEDPEQIAACLRELALLPEVAVLDTGFSDLCCRLLTYLGEPVRKLDEDFNVGDLIHRQRVLVLPTGSLDGRGRAPAFKRRLEEYVRAGGRVIALCQFRGEDYGALPLELDGFGWQEDQSCHNASMRIAMDHPCLSGQDSEFLDISCDGFFSRRPDNAAILLRRAAHDRPCLVDYAFGKGRVIAATAFMDWAFGHHQYSADELVLMRDLVGYAKCPDEPPQFDPADPTISVPVTLTNPTSAAGVAVRFTLIEPDKTVRTARPDLVEDFERFDPAVWEKPGVHVERGILHFEGTGNNFHTHLYHERVYPRAELPGLTVSFSIESEPELETEFHVSMENTGKDQEYRRHGIIARRGRIVAQARSARGWSESTVSPHLVAHQTYRLEIRFTAEGSALYLYPAYAARPAQPSHFLESADWDPRLHFWIKRGRAVVHEIRVELDREPVFVERFEKPALDEAWHAGLCRFGQGYMVMTGTGNSWQSHCFSRAVFHRRARPHMRCLAMVEDAEADTLCHVSCESAGDWGEPHYRRHGVIFRKGRVHAQRAVRGSNHETLIHDGLEAGKWYVIEIEFEDDGSKLFFYPEDEAKPAEPRHVFEQADWSPRVHFWSRNSTARVRELSMGTRQDPRIVVQQALPPGATQSVGLSVTGPFAQGIWRVDAAILDSAGELLAEVYSAARFSVDNFDDTVTGFGLKGSPLRFSLTSENEDILVGDANLFSAHIWSNDNVSRSITVHTYFNHDYSAEDELCALTPGGYFAAERSLPELGAGSHTLWAAFIDENNNTLARLNKVFRVHNPRIELELRADTQTLAPRSKLPVWAELRNLHDVPLAVNLLFRLSDPEGNAIDEKQLAGVPVPFGELVSQAVEFQLPTQLAAGKYRLAVTAGYRAGQIAAKHLDFSADLEGEVSGFLLDAVTGLAIPTATIALDRGDNLIQLDEAGYFSGASTAGYHTLYARAPGYHNLDLRLTLSAARNTRLQSLYLRPVTGSLSGFVRDLVSGEAIEGVELQLAGQKNTTGRDGGFLFEQIPAGMHAVRYGHPAYHRPRDLKLQIHAGRRQTITGLTLHPLGGVLTGKLISAVSKQPLAAARVWGDSLPVRETDESGDFRLEAVPEGRRHFYFEAPGYPRRRMRLEVAAGRETELGDVRLMPTHGTLSGKVLDAISRQPLAEVRVKGDGFVELLTGEDGEFQTQPISRRNAWIRFHKEGYGEPTLYAPVYPERETRLASVWLMPLLGEVTGTVKDSISGRAVADARVILERVTTTTDTDGRFTLSGIAAGSRWLRVLAAEDRRGYYPHETKLQVNIHGGRVSDVGTLYLAPGRAVLNGTVVQALNGEKLAGTTIRLAGQSAQSDADGRFSLEVPAGRHWGTVQPPESAQLRFACDCPAGSSIELTPLVWPEGKARVTGRVTRDDSGEPLAGALVGLHPDQAVATDADGSFSLGELGAGSPRLWVKAGEQGPEQWLRLALPNGSFVSLEIVYEEAAEDKPFTLTRRLTPIPVKGRLYNAVTGDAVSGATIAVDHPHNRRGRLVQRSNIHGGDTHSGLLGTHITAGESWSGMVFTARVFASDNDGFGLLFRYRDEGHYYRLVLLSEGGPYRRLECCRNGAFEVLAQDAYSYPRNRWFPVEIRAVGDRLQVTIDGRLVFDVRDDAYPDGKIGFMCNGQVNQEFAEITVSDPEGNLLFHEDALRGLADWTVVDDGDRSGPSQWLMQPPLAAVSDAQGRFTLSLEPGEHRLYAFAEGFQTLDTRSRELLVYGAYGREPVDWQLSMMPTTSSLEGRLLDAISGLPIAGASIWLDNEDTAAGGLLQRSNIHSSAPDVYDGTRLVTRRIDFQDYSFNCRLKATDNDGLALLFRYRDTRNYCRVLMVEEGGPFTRLESVVNGERTILDQKQRAYPRGQWFSMNITLEGNRIEVLLGELRLFDLSIPGPETGGIGFECHGQTDQWFADVSLTATDGSLLLEDRFDQGLAQWYILDLGDRSRPSNWQWFPDSRVETDEEGRFRLTEVVPGDHQIHFRKAGYQGLADSFLGRLQVLPGINHRRELFARAREAELRGRVRDSVSGKPLAGVSIRTGDASLRTTSAEDGSFVLAGVPGSQVIPLFAFLPGYSSGHRDGSVGRWLARPGDHGMVDCYLEPQRYDLRVEVRDQISGEPLPEIVAKIADSGLNTLARDGSAVHFERVPLNLRSLMLNAAGFRTLGRDAAAVSIDPVAGGDERLVVYLAPMHGHFTGTVVDLISGKPLEGIAVLVDNGAQAAVSNRAGRFSVSAAEGPHRIYFIDRRYTAGSGAGLAFDLYIARGCSLDVLVFLVPVGGRISGILRDSVNQTTVAEAQVRLDDGWIQAGSDELGHFDLAVPPGPHKLYIRAARYAAFNESGLFLESWITPGRDLNVSGYLDPGTGRARFQLTDLPERVVLKPAATNSVTCTVKNTGANAGTAHVQLMVPGIGSFERDQWLDAGGETRLDFAVPVPEDYLESANQEAVFLLDGLQRFVSLRVKGLRIVAEASLDRTHYSPGETAKLSIDLRNTAAAPISIFAVVRFHGSVQRSQIVSLQKETRLEFSIPVTDNRGKLFYGIYTDTSRALVLDTLYFYPKDETLSIETAKQSYVAGEELELELRLLQEPPLQGVEVQLFGPETDVVLVTGEPFPLAVDQPYQLRLPIPGNLVSGSYGVRVKGGERVWDHPLDVRGLGVLVRRITLDRRAYERNDHFEAELEIEVEEDFVAELETRLLSPSKAVLLSQARRIELQRGLNRVTTADDFTSSQSGSHFFAYRLYSWIESGDDSADEERRLLASGSKLFDVMGHSIAALLLDREQSVCGETVKLQMVAYGLGAATLTIRLDGRQLAHRPWQLNGRTLFETELTVQRPGRHLIHAELAGETGTTRRLEFFARAPDQIKSFEKEVPAMS
ncbi:MAG: carboxypeptidase regulatory-like domain-containing protein [Acidobacteriota bacterium]|nr:carboxypeptidase regulatory-like domain-containing protein [Acidobacteriota bacterium]